MYYFYTNPILTCIVLSQILPNSFILIAVFALHTQLLCISYNFQESRPKNYTIKMINTSETAESRHVALMNYAT